MTKIITPLYLTFSYLRINTVSSTTIRLRLDHHQLFSFCKYVTGRCGDYERNELGCLQIFNFMV